MPFMSDSQVAKLQTWAEKMRATQQRVKAKAEAATAKAMRVAEIAGTAGLMGYTRGQIEGRGRTFEVLKMSPELLVGLGVIGASFFEVFGKYDDDMLNVGIGSLAAYATLALREQGVKAGKNQTLLPPTKVSGMGDLFGGSVAFGALGSPSFGASAGVTESEILTALRAT